MERRQRTQQWRCRGAALQRGKAAAWQVRRRKTTCTRTGSAYRCGSDWTFEELGFGSFRTNRSVDEFSVPLDPHVIATQRRMLLGQFLRVQDRIVWNFNVLSKLRVKIESGISIFRRFTDVA